MTYLKKYKGVNYEQLKNEFFNIEKIFKYGKNIIPIYKYKKTFNRVGSHLILVKKKYILEALYNGKYNNELRKKINAILKREKNIFGEKYCILIDHKNDQAREVMDYIIKNNINTKVIILSDDNMFWFFHDIGHSYLSDVVNNFYENVYGYPEQLVNLFAAIKLKQYGMYNYDNIVKEAVIKSYAYKKEDHEYFISILNELNFENDF